MSTISNLQLGYAYKCSQHGSWWRVIKVDSKMRVNTKVERRLQRVSSHRGYTLDAARSAQRAKNLMVDSGVSMAEFCIKLDVLLEKMRTEELANATPF